MTKFNNYNLNNGVKWEDINITMFDYQKAIHIKSGRDALICNWSRGLGATYTILATILKNRPENVLYLRGKHDWLNSLKNKLDEILKMNNDLKNSIKDIHMTKEDMRIVFYDFKVINIVNWHTIPVDHNVMNFDYIFFDGILPTSLKNITGNRTISFVTTNNYDFHLEKLYGNCTTNILNEDYKTGMNVGMFNQSMMDKIKDNCNIKQWYEEHAIMSKPEENNKEKDSEEDINRKYELYQSFQVTPANKFLMDSLIGLQEEYDAIAKTKDTVLTRKNLLEMIGQLYKSIKNI